MSTQPISADSAVNAAPSPFAVRRHWTGSWRGGVVLVVALLGLYLPGQFVLPPIDRDESRFAEASRRMAASADWHGWVVPMIQDTPRLNKPPLIYWLQAASERLFGARIDVHPPLPSGGIWAYRLPSILGALLAALATWQLGLRMYARPVGFVAALLLGSCMVVMVDVRQARTDQVLLGVTTVAMAALWTIWHGRDRTRWGAVLLLWLAVGVGVLTKGPVTPVLVVLTVLALCWVTWEWRWLGRLHVEVGVVIGLALVLPWVMLVVREVGWATYRQVLTDELLGRSVSAMEGHAAWPGYYLLLLPVLLWPGSLVLGPALWRALGGPWRQPGRPELFCLAWVVPFWLLFELIATKLPHYTLPTFPALALLGARGLYTLRRGWTPLLRTWVGRVALWGWYGLAIGIGMAVPIGLVFAGRLRAEPAVLITLNAAVLVCAVLAGALAVLLARRRFVSAMVWSIVLAGVMHAATLELVLPRLDRLWISSRVMTALDQLDPASARPLAAAGYHEDSLVFLTRGRVQRLNWVDLADWLAGHRDGLAVVSARPELADAPLTVHATIEGFNIGNGQAQRVLIVEAKP